MFVPLFQTHFKGYPNLLSDTYLPNGCLIFLTENLSRGVEIGRGEEVQEKFFQG